MIPKGLKELTQKHDNIVNGITLKRKTRYEQAIPIFSDNKSKNLLFGLIGGKAQQQRPQVPMQDSNKSMLMNYVRSNMQPSALSDRIMQDIQAGMITSIAQIDSMRGKSSQPKMRYV